MNEERDRTQAAREVALREIAATPGILQRDLAPRIVEEVGLAPSTVVRLLRSLESEGVIEARMHDRRKGYALAGAAEEPPPAPEPGPLEEPEAAEPEPPPPPEPPTAFGPAPEPDIPPASGSRRRRPLLTALGVAALVVAVALVLVLRDGESSDTSREPALAEDQPAATTPRTQTAPAEEAPERPLPRPSAIKLARTMELAVLSGSNTPGIAGRTGRQLERSGFWVNRVANAPGPSEVSVVLYSRGAEKAARALARRLRIGQVRRAGGSVNRIAPGARLYVIVGADRT